MRQFSEWNNTRSASKILEVEGLTKRERQVLLWMIQGKTNAEIGKILGISFHTASKHVEHIFLKLGVHSRIQAFNKVLELCEKETYQGYDLVSRDVHQRVEVA